MFLFWSAQHLQFKQHCIAYMQAIAFALDGFYTLHDANSFTLISLGKKLTSPKKS